MQKQLLQIWCIYLTIAIANGDRDYVFMTYNDLSNFMSDNNFNKSCIWNYFSFSCHMTYVLPDHKLWPGNVFLEGAAYVHKYSDDISENQHIQYIQIISKDADENIDILESDLKLISTKLPHLKKIKWDITERCRPMSIVIPKFKNLEILDITLGLVDKVNCHGIDLNFQNQIRELQMIMKLSSQDQLFKDTNIMLGSLENLETLVMKCNRGLNIKIPLELFQSMNKLTTLEMHECHLIDMNDKYFNYLVNLKNLTLNSSTFADNQWLLSPVIQSKLIYLHVMPVYFNVDLNISAILCGNLQFYEKCRLNLDINKKRCPKYCDCSLNITDFRFEIDCNYATEVIEILELPIPIAGNASLHFNNKNLTSLPNSSLYGFSNLRELHLANNQISHLYIENLPINLTYLDIRNNSLQSLDEKVLKFLSSRAGNITLLLDGNPWTCNCSVLNLIRFIADKSNNIENREFLECYQQNITVIMYALTASCGSHIGAGVTLIGCLFGTITIILILFLLFKKSILMWLYERNICLCFLRIVDPDQESNVGKIIDAFLAFSHLDMELIEEFVEKLERGPRKHQLCLYQRDWAVGVSIPQCILQTIEDARSIIILMTENFANSSWGLFEFRNSIQAAAMDKKKKLIIVVYPEVDIDKLDSELRVYLKFHTYLKRDDPSFWRKLLFAMPHKPKQVEPVVNPEFLRD